LEKNRDGGLVCGIIGSRGKEDKVTLKIKLRSCAVAKKFRIFKGRTTINTNRNSVRGPVGRKPQRPSYTADADAHKPAKAGSVIFGNTEQKRKV